MEQKITLKLFLSFLIICLGVVSVGFGQIIFHNPIEGTNPGADNPYTNGQVVDPNITVSGIGRGPEINALGVVTNDRYNASGWTTEDDIDFDEYFEFTLTPNTGYEINFESFIYTSQESDGGPTLFGFRSSIDDYASDIGNPTSGGGLIDLTAYQNITSTVKFRLYAWNANAGTGTFSINDFTFKGVVSPLSCVSTSTWNGSSWSGEEPDLTTVVIIDGDYNTSIGSFQCCSLIVMPNATLTVADETFIEVEDDVTIEGNLIIENQGSFVQYGDSFTGTAMVNKTTKEYNDATLHYVYWSSPIENANLSAIFPNPYLNRRYYFDASLYLDQYETGTGAESPDDIDDDNNAWRKASEPMEIGRGYAIATDNSAGPPYSNTHQFTGTLNTGDITVPIFRNAFENDTNWNLIGNPYPSAIDATEFIRENYYDGSTGTIDGPIYVWNSEGVAVAGNPGFDTYNFSQTDYYDLINLIGGTAPGPGLVPIPSGQGFFVSYHDNGESISSNGDITEGEVYFNNIMRIADDVSNSDFYKNSNVKGKTSTIDNKLWIKLTSNNGVFDQILIGYLDIATDNYDGEAFDASKKLSSKAASIHSIIPGSNKKFAIQGKAATSLNAHETILLSFATNIPVETLYTLSLAHLQGEFLTTNTIYLKDNLLDTVHNLSDSDYAFTSEVGEFNDRFVVLFNNTSLSIDELDLDENLLHITDLNNGEV